MFMKFRWPLIICYYVAMSAFEVQGSSLENFPKGQAFLYYVEGLHRWGIHR